MGSLGEPSILDLFLGSVERFPNNAALVFPHQPPGLYGLQEGAGRSSDLYLRVTYKALDRGVQRLAAALADDHGMKPGVPLFVFCFNRLEYVLSTLCSYYADLVHVPFTPASLSNIGDVEYMMTLVLEYAQAERAIVIANDADTAEALDPVIERLGADCVKVVISDEPRDGWISFGALMAPSEDVTFVPGHPSSLTARTVLFTSGTTSKPKGCLTKPGRWMDTLETSLCIGSAEPGEAVAVTVPNHHAFGHICMMLPLLRGATVVFPEYKFSPDAVLYCCQRERCAYIAMVPSMVYMLLQALQSRLEYATWEAKGLLFAGSVMAPETIQQFQRALGVANIENFYGMTEGVFCSTGPVRNIKSMTSSRDVSIGKPTTGAQVRICYPGTKCPVPTGTAGELHFSGPTCIEGYMKGGEDNFYEADGQIWFITGDRAYVDPAENRLFIVGRYKDMIIRAGENISPAKIEAVLAEIPAFRTLEPEVVTAPDSTAGEVPVLIIRGSADGHLREMMRNVVRSRLGNIYVPSEIIPIKDLGSDDYPRTAIGKVQKAGLAEKVAQFYQQQTDGYDKELNGSYSTLESKVVETWARFLGLQPDQMDIHAPISRWADSIFQLSGRDKIKKATGRSVPMSTWLQAESIAEQIGLLEQVPTVDAPDHSAARKRLPIVNQRLGPPDVHEMVHVNGEQEVLDNTKAAVEDAFVGFGLSWDDVQDIFPCTDFIQIVSKARVAHNARLVDTWLLRPCIITHDSDVKVSFAC